MRFFFFTLCIMFAGFTAKSQTTITVKGRVVNAEGKPINNALVVLHYKPGADSIKRFTDDKGIFSFSDVQPSVVSIQASFAGYIPFAQNFTISKDRTEQQLPEIKLLPSATTLENLTLESSKVQIKEDTVSYQVDSTMYRKNDNVEELLKKLPGIQVDNSGTVTAQGKEVTKVKVNGKEFFNGDVRTATRELNAEMVDKIQVIDDYGDQAAFTGVKDGDPSKTLNIQLKKDRNKGYFGNVTAGAGTHDRYATSLSINRFNDDRQISVLGNWNNTNASLFNFGSFGGPMGSMISSMARGMGIGQGGGGVAAVIGNFGISDGIGPTKSIGINYRDQWGKHLSVYGSYSFSQKNITTLKEITEEDFFRDFSNINKRDSRDYTKTGFHRFSFNMEFKTDTFNYFKFTPGINYRSTKSNYSENNAVYDESNYKLSDGQILETANTKLPTYSGNLLFNHKFHKKGRLLSANLTGVYGSNTGTDDLLAGNRFFFQGTTRDTATHQFIPQENKNYNYGVKLSFTEPIDKKRSIEVNYSFNNQRTATDRQTYIVDNTTNDKSLSDSLSVNYENDYVTNKFGVNYKTNTKKYNYSIGLAVQPATISSDTVGGKTKSTQHLVNYFPVIRFAYNFSRSRSFNFNYNGSSNQPAAKQLQPVRDNSNPRYISIGNPSLKPEFTHIISTRYNNFDFISGNVFFGNLSFSLTNDKIVTNTTSIGPGTQETRYLNSNGFYNATGFYNISRPKQNRKYVFNWGGNIIFNNNVSFISNEKNIGRNWVVGQRLSMDYKLKKWLETNVAINYSLNKTHYSLKSASLQDLQTNTLDLSNATRIFFPKDLVFGFDIDKTINSGYSDYVNADPLILNGSLEKQFFKKKNLSLKAQAFDVFNENKGISRAVSAQSIVDTRTNRLGRYFMLSLIFRLNKFAAQSQMSMPGNMMPHNMMMPPGM